MTPSGANRKRGIRSLLASRAAILTFRASDQGSKMTEIETVERKRAAEIPLHGPEAFEAMRRVCRLTAECLDMLTDYVKPGVTKTICTSINHVVCHGIPNDKPLRDGDIMNIDVTLILDGWHGDSSRMYYVGEVPRRAQRL